MEVCTLSSTVQSNLRIDKGLKLKTPKGVTEPFTPTI